MVQIWKKVSAVSLGTTGAVEVSATQLKVPEWADIVLGIRPNSMLITPTANQSLEVKGRLVSDDLSVVPCEFLLNPVGGLDATTGGVMVGEAPYYPLNIPVKGGEGLDFKFTSLKTNTVAPYAWTDVLFGQRKAGDVPPSLYDPLPFVQRFGKVGTLTAVTAATATGTAYTITGAKAIIDFMGLIGKDTMTDSKPCIGYFQFESSGFKYTPQQMHVEPVGAVLGATDAPKIACVTRARVALPCAATSVIQDYYTQEGGTAETTDDWITGVWFARVKA